MLNLFKLFDEGKKDFSKGIWLFFEVYFIDYKPLITRDSLIKNIANPFILFNIYLLIHNYSVVLIIKNVYVTYAILNKRLKIG